MNQNEWVQKTLQEIIALRRDINSKADKSTVEQLAHYSNLPQTKTQNDARIFLRSDYFFNESSTNSYANKQIEDKNNIILLENRCLESVASGDISTGFLTLFRYIESIDEHKADVSEVADKASRVYVEQLFQRILTSNRQQIRDSTLALQESIESQFNNLVDEYSNLTKEIFSREDAAEQSLSEIEDVIMKFAGISTKTKQKFVGRKRPKTVRVIQRYMKKTPASIEAAKERKHAIIEPQKPKKKPEAQISDLISTLTISPCNLKH